MKLMEIQNNPKGPQDYKIFCDLDGVLADFVKGVQKLAPDYTEEKYSTDKQFKKDTWAAIKKYTDEGGELWYNLDMLPDAKQLWDYIKSYNPEILTATGTSAKSVADQKYRWVKKHLGNPTVHIVTRAEEKAKFAGEKYILIDDKKRAIDPWVAAGGIGIHHTSAATTIQQLKRLGF